ncbi:carbonate dehydratase [Hypericibacter adhaerens]|uniref:Carbonic anhydrase n=2 Tax=Hypericibacter adhaerens TaxID=2602016 RepID=A0A5J6NA72_9PROT|nr:carbonate dehydratase [Hypericibacter adhaerens]
MSLMKSRDVLADSGTASHGEAAHWSYEGEAGPQNWGELSADFKVCELGFEQTPIDLKNAISAQLAGVEPDFRPMPLKILNNGHTIQVNCDPGSRSRIDGRSFELLQFHFHHPSEHLLAGRAFDLELHFVHRAESGQLAVLGVFIQQGAENAALQPIWAGMPAVAGPVQDVGTQITPASLLPTERGFFRYQGSLTTPPCSEGVLWTMFKQPIEASEDQIRKFAALFPSNARPVQGVNRRFLLQSL